MGDLKRRTPSTAFEPDDGKRLKRFRRMLLDDCKMDAVLEVDGIQVSVHREVLVASSSVLALLGDNIPVTGASVEVVRHFVGYLYGFNCFEDGELSINEALDLADLFVQFDIKAAAAKAARYCLQKCSTEHLNNMCRVLGQIKEIHSELAKKVADNLNSVDMAFVDKSTMTLVLTSLRLTTLQKLIAVTQWTKANCENNDIKQLYETIDVSYAAQSVKGMDERLNAKNKRINSLVAKLSKEEDDGDKLAGKLKELKKKNLSLTRALDDKEKKIAALQSAHRAEVEELNSQLALFQNGTRNFREPRQITDDKTSTSRITQGNGGGNTTSSDRNSKQMPIIPPKKRTLDPETEQDKVTPSKSIILATDNNPLRNKEVALDAAEPRRKNSPDTATENEQGIVSKNVSQMNALAEEILFVQSAPCYEVPAPDSSSSDEFEGEDSNTGNTIAETENKPKPLAETDDEDEEELYRFTDKDFDVDVEKQRHPVARTSISFEIPPTNPEKACEQRLPDIPEDSEFGKLVSDMRSKWSHPDDGSPLSPIFYHARAIMVKRKMTQKSLAREAGISQSVASLYLRGLHKGNVRKVEHKLIMFIRKFVDNSDAKLFQSVPSGAQESSSNGIGAADEQVEEEETNDGQDNETTELEKPNSEVADTTSPVPSPAHVSVARRAYESRQAGALPHLAPMY